MEQTQDDKPRTPEVTSAQLRKSVHRRLREYVRAQYPRPSISDVVSIAVERYLDEQERDS